MSFLHTIKPRPGSVKNRKRVGRGDGSGKGTTAGRGTKGAQSRSGYSLRPGFAGGNVPWHLRFPKRGFKNPNRVEYVVINVGDLQRIVEKHGLQEVSPDQLRRLGVLKKKLPLKILGEGDWSLKITVKAHAFSKSAKEKIEKAGGRIEVIPR